MSQIHCGHKDTDDTGIAALRKKKYVTTRNRHTRTKLYSIMLYAAHMFIAINVK